MVHGRRSNAPGCLLVFWGASRLDHLTPRSARVSPGARGCVLAARIQRLGAHGVHGVGDKSGTSVASLGIPPVRPTGGPVCVTTVRP